MVSGARLAALMHEGELWQTLPRPTQAVSAAKQRQEGDRWW